jgi:hypothetical protein
VGGRTRTSQGYYYGCQSALLLSPDFVPHFRAFGGHFEQMSVISLEMVQELICAMWPPFCLPEFSFIPAC